MDTSAELARELEGAREQIRAAATDHEALAQAATALSALALRVTSAVEDAFLEILKADAA